MCCRLLKKTFRSYIYINKSERSFFAKSDNRLRVWNGMRERNLLLEQRTHDLEEKKYSTQ